MRDPRPQFPLLTPPRALAAALAVAVLLAALPQSWLAPARGWAFSLLQPGQRVAGVVVDVGRRVNGRVTSHFTNAVELASARQTVQRLATENHRLAQQVEALQHRIATHDAQTPAAERSLLKLGGVEARVVGRQARSYLLRRELLDVGLRDGIEPGALVLRGAAILDRGEGQGVRSGHLVLAAAGVWGMVVQTGPNTAVMRTLTSPGFRDVVRLRSPDGPEGILDGVGESLCRIRLVDITEPAAVGDEVLAASLAGLGVPLPRYGVIDRVEQPVGAAHWDLWMRPALTGPSPDTVIVVRVEP
ncbi:MAG: rod shape-determining protein MreC [Patescibacteria group bacterium]|nr:rod shape-determining protein MreC [Patescibacteria group bacterium]